MDRKTFQDGSSFQPGQVWIHTSFAAGSSGAVPAMSAWLRRAGVTGCVLSGTGLYTFTFQDTYVDCLNYIMEIDQATYSASHGCWGVLGAQFSGNVNTIAFQAVNAAGAATVPTSGDIIRLSALMLKSKQGL